MTWMNRYEIEEARAMLRTHPVLGPATKFLYEFMLEVDSHSDGWPYWTPPSHAAAQLMKIIEDHRTSSRRWPPTVEPTIEDVQKAIRPIKAFMTRRGNAAGMILPDLQLTLPLGGRR